MRSTTPRRAHHPVPRRALGRAVPLAVAFAVVAAACAGGGDGDATGTTGELDGATTTAPTTTVQPLPDCPVDALDGVTTPVQITFWHAMTNENDVALQKVTEAYNARQDKVRVTLQNQNSYDENFDKFRTAAEADRPHVVQLPEYYLQIMADSRSAIPVQSCVNAEGYDLSDYVERATGYYTIQGALQAMPFNVSVPVLYYNKVAFQKAGLDPEVPPKTLDDLRAFSEKIVSSGAATYGIALDTDADAGGGWFIEQFFARGNQMYANNDNGRSARATEVLFNNDFAAESLGALGRLVADKLAFNVGENPQGIGQLLKIADPKEPAAMAIYTSAGLGSVLNLLRAGTVPGITDADLGIGPMPAPPGDGGFTVGGAALYVVAKKTPEETAAAWDYIKYLTSPEVQSQWAAATGYIPVRQSAPDLDPLKTTHASDPRFTVAFDQLMSGPLTPATAGPVLGPMRQVRGITAKAVQAILSGADPVATLDAAAAEANAVIADYNRRVGG